MKKIFLFIFLIIIITTKMHAEVSITASVDKNTVNFGDSITLQVNVSGDVSNIPKPELPALTDFNVYSSGTSQNISFVNGRVSSSITYNFILSPNKSGKFTIGAVNLTIGGKTYSTNPINIEVLTTGAALPQGQVNVPQPNVNDAENQETTENQGLFVTAVLNKKRVFVNEAITYTFRFFTSRNLCSSPGYNPPNFTGFIVEDLPPQKNYQTVINGKRYNVTEIKTALFPTSPGTYNIGTASLKANIRDFTSDPFGNFFDDDFFRGFFGTGKSVVVNSKPLSIEVIPLPYENKPTNFSGAVGNYSINVTADKSETEANNPITLTVSISGEGNIKSISEPKFPNIVGVRKYDTISSVNISKSNYKVSGSKTFKTVIVPERTGYLVIPEIEFLYFDTDKNAYKKIKSNSIKIKVIPSSIPSLVKLPTVISGINIVGQDIRFIKTEIGKKSNSKVVTVISNIILAISVLIFLFSIGYNRYNYFILKNTDVIKSRRAFKAFDKSVNNLLKSHAKTEDFYSRVFELLIKYLSDKTGMALSGCTFNEIENILLQKNLSLENIKKIREILENANFIRFAPLVKWNVDLKNEVNIIKGTITDIEKGWEL